MSCTVLTLKGHSISAIMKQLLFLSVFLGTIWTASCQNIVGSNERTVNGVRCVTKDMSVNEFEKKLSTPGVQLVDVRTPGEFAEGHLANASNIDYRGGELQQKAAKLDKKRPVLVYCHSGKRSAASAAELQAMGFTEVYNLKGGIAEWQGAGKPVQ